MLPLDKLSVPARTIFEKHGVSEEDILMVLNLDLDAEGNFGAGCVALTKTELLLISFPADSVLEEKRKPHLHEHRENKEITEEKHFDIERAVYHNYSLSHVENIYIDSFVSSNRLCIVKDGVTISAAYCTNAKKQQLYAFIDLKQRIEEGKMINEDDKIFEQFNTRCPKCGEPYRDQNHKVCQNCINKSAIFARLVKYFQSYKLQLVTMLCCMGASALISLISPYMSGVILYDKVLSAEPSPYTILGITVDLKGQILPVVGIIFALGLLSLTVGILQNRASISLANKVTLKMKLDIFTAMQKLSLSYFNNNQTGRLITRVNYDADIIKNFFTNGVPYLIVNSITFTCILIILLLTNFYLTLIVLVPVPVIVLMIKRFFPKLWRMQTKIWRRTSALNSMLGDTLTGIRVVKTFAKEAEEADRFTYYSRRLYMVNLQYNALVLTIFPLMYLLISISSQIIWGVGGVEIIGQKMNFGQLMTFLGYLGMIYGPLEFFTNLAEQLTNTANCAERMFEVLDAIPEITDSKNAREIEIKGNIKFDNVSFHYNANRRILKNVSMEIKAGENIGLVGHTGSGKSTMANLIMRLYDVIAGTITIDGVNVKDIKIDILRKNIAVVSQEIFLFRGTIAENIKYARPDATMEQIIDAAKAANAHDFISNLPEGYETQVGIGSRSLSGGEMQRISIARALLLDPKILILDEATAAMDTETERLIQEALHKLTKNRTTIVIAHRLSTLKDCSRLFALENGEIVESGTHEELLKQKGVYYKLYTLQTEAFKEIMTDKEAS